MTVIRSGHITAIEPIRGTNRYRIVIDGRPGFELHRDLVLQHHLRPNQYLTASRQETLVREDARLRLREKAFSLLAQRPHTTDELRRKLRQRGFIPGDIEHLLTDLQERGYLDDRAFARAFVEARHRSRGWGPSRLRAELMKRGVDSAWIEEALNEMLEEDALFERACHLASRFQAKRAYRHTDPAHRTQKLINFLLRKGYSYEICRRVIEHLQKNG